MEKIEAKREAKWKRGATRWTITDQQSEIVCQINKRPYGDKNLGDFNGDIIAIAPEMFEIIARVSECSDIRVLSDIMDDCNALIAKVFIPSATQ